MSIITGTIASVATVCVRCFVHFGRVILSTWWPHRRLEPQRKAVGAGFSYSPLSDVSVVSDMAVFVLKRDAKLQPTNQPTSDVSILIVMITYLHANSVFLLPSLTSLPSTLDYRALRLWGAVVSYLLWRPIYYFGNLNDYSVVHVLHAVSLLLCVPVCVLTITVEQNDLWPRYLAWWSIFILSRSNS